MVLNSSYNMLVLCKYKNQEPILPDDTSMISLLCQKCMPIEKI